MSRSKIIGERSKKPNVPRLCMFCGEDQSKGPMSREHFVPQCLWDMGLPSLVLTLPAHVSCNQAFSDDNDYFRLVLAYDEGA